MICRRLKWILFSKKSIVKKIDSETSLIDGMMRNREVWGNLYHIMYIHTPLIRMKLSPHLLGVLVSNLIKEVAYFKDLLTILLYIEFITFP